MPSGAGSQTDRKDFHHRGVRKETVQKLCVSELLSESGAQADIPGLSGGGGDL